MDHAPMTPVVELTGVEVFDLMISEGVFPYESVDQIGLIDEFDFRQKLDGPVRDYSGGENQLFKILLTLSRSPSWFFLDEPTQFLDITNTKKLVQLISRKLSEGYHFLVIEHQAQIWNVWIKR